MNDMSPFHVQEAVREGMRRTQNFRRARLMFIRQYVGQYYDQDHGDIGMEPMNLIFNAIRVLVPNIVYNFPKHNVATDFLDHREYGNMLGMALSYDDKRQKIKNAYRRAIIDAIFTLGILKTGLASSDSRVMLDDQTEIDPGTVFTDTVDFDNFILDPQARRLTDVRFVGDKIRVNRQMALDSGLYKNEILEHIPSVSDSYRDDEAADLSRGEMNPHNLDKWNDEIEIAELWIPSERALVSVPVAGPYKNQFLRVEDYYGPDRGPYTYLSLTNAAPNNPFGPSMVGIWYDLHVMANRMVHKALSQADRQKTLVAYRRSSADDAQEALDAADGEAIAVDEPDGIRTIEFGGNDNNNPGMVEQIRSWFNLMAANPEGMAGMNMNTSGGTATEASLLQQNASIGLNDMKDMVYTMAAEEAEKRAWYFHTDPLIEIPLVKRESVPAVWDRNPLTGQQELVEPARQEDVQIMLTPEARRGDFVEYHFTIEPESMGRVDSGVRLQRALEFGVKVLPAAATAAQTMALLGQPFSVKKYIIRMAKEIGIEWMDEVFDDPEFQMMQQMLMARTPQMEGSQGIMQNGQPPSVGAVDNMGPAAMAQEGANAGQAALPIREL